jgi:hypothetical protein
MPRRHVLRLRCFDARSTRFSTDQHDAYNHQKSVATLNEACEIGGMGGDGNHVLDGSTVGRLVPSKGYRDRTLVTINGPTKSHPPWERNP